MIINISKCSCGGMPTRHTEYIQKSRNYLARITCSNCGEAVTGTSREFHNMAMRRAAAAWNEKQKLPEGE